MEATHDPKVASALVLHPSVTVGTGVEARQIASERYNAASIEPLSPWYSRVLGFSTGRAIPSAYLPMRPLRAPYAPPTRYTGP
eukprot:2537076-Rhodomonas_salina.1